MKSARIIFLTCIFLSFNFHLFAQESFDKGYIIDNLGNRKECLIKNIYKVDNPEMIEYKLIGSTEVKTASVAEITEFGITDTLKYVRSIVKIDKSEDGLNDRVRAGLHLVNDTLFLNQLIEGKANLYRYSLGSMKRFFFNVEGDTIKQLIYKRYLEDGKEQKDLTYIQQLIAKVNCQNFRFDRFQNINYSTKSLILFFEEYNECENVEYINFESKIKRRNLINMYARAGINISQNELKRAQIRYFDKGTGVGPKLGYEIEVLLPITKKDIFSVFGEISYYQFKIKMEDDTPLPPRTNPIVQTYSNYTFTHKNLEAAVGLRAYLPLNKNNAFFTDFSLAVNNEIKSEIVTRDYSIKYAFDPSTIYGIGYKYKKIIIQAKYYTKQPQPINGRSGDGKQNVSGFVFTLGYHFF